jgi:osmoprotectant transport system permease protein
VTPGEPLIRWDWLLHHTGDIAQRVTQHLVLTLLAVGIGLALSLLLGIYAARRPRVYAPITWVAGILYTIPSLALFALLIPFTGLTIVTAEIGLVSYTLLILIRNVVSGIQAVPAEVRDSAVGMGYTPWQVLWDIELPLALAIIIAGVRVATITTIGLVTVTALIGQGGLGYFILDGIQRFFSTPLILGAVMSVALAVIIDALLVAIQRRVTPWTRVGA